MVASTIKRFGAVHLMCNFAGAYEQRGGTTELSEEKWDLLHAVTLRGAWLCCKYSMQAMALNDYTEPRGCRGAIVNIASALAHRGQAGFVAYVSARAGVIGLTRAAAADGGPLRIRVNAISPGVTRTPAALAQGPITQDRESTLAAYGLLPFIGEAEDQANAALYLCSDEAAFVTGAVLNVDGGWTARH
jgi:NAD(P)-dependent dehydrogenase (short-subunit alcohol dehydrogenase family)